MKVEHNNKILKWEVSCTGRETVIVEAKTILDAKIAAAQVYGEPWTSIIRDMSVKYISVADVGNKRPKKKKKRGSQNAVK